MSIIKTLNKKMGHNNNEGSTYFKKVLELKMISAVNAKVFLILVVILVFPLINAGNYGTGAYGANQYNFGETTAEAGSSTGGGGSGGGSGGGVAKTAVISNGEDGVETGCITGLDCGTTEYCFEGVCHAAECFDDISCMVDEVCHQFRCVKLFDVEIKEFESPTKLGDFFYFTYFIKGMADFNDDVIIYFKIESDGLIVTSGQDVIYLASFEEKTKKTKLFLPSTVASGVYTFSVETSYGNYRAESFRTIEIVVNEEGTAKISLSPEERVLVESIMEWGRNMFKPFISKYLYFILAGLGLILLSILVIVLVNKVQKKPRKMKRKSKNTVVKLTYRERILNNLRLIKKKEAK
jgi:hypothetical protein